MDNILVALVVVVQVSIVIMPLLLIVALLRVRRIFNKSRYIVLLGVTFSIGLYCLLTFMYYLHKTNCGMLYDPDAGCSKEVSGTFIIVGGIAGMLVSMISGSIIFSSFKFKKPS